MDEKIAGLLAQYEVDVYRAGRVKGAWLLETDRGLKLFGGCPSSEGKIESLQQVKMQIKEHGFTEVDCYIPTREGNYLVQGPYNETFVMRDWFLGEECDSQNIEHICQTVKTLARLHNCMEQIRLSEEMRVFCQQTKLTELLEKRNRELRRVRTYIRSKKQKNAFEQKFLSQFSLQYEQAERAMEHLDREQYEAYYGKVLEQGSMLHGNFTHHSVIFHSGGIAVTGFQRIEMGIQIHDFYLLFRKMMEKWEWDIRLGEEMLAAYEGVRLIPGEERELLVVLLSYPEKFWKVANQYYNNRKSWIPEKNMQKLIQTMEQAKKKEESIQRLFT